MRRTDDYNLTEFDATCDENGQFPQKLSWPLCANGDQYFTLLKNWLIRHILFSDILCWSKHSGVQPWNWNPMGSGGLCWIQHDSQVIWSSILQFCSAWFLSRWKCKDPKHLIQRKGSPKSRNETIESKCLWTSNFTIDPTELECIISFCVDLPHIPEEVFMEEVDDMKKTRVNTSKLYQCKVG